MPRALLIEAGTAGHCALVVLVSGLSVSTDSLTPRALL